MATTIKLNGRKMLTRDLLHAYLAKRLHLPSYYGKNLDALHDCLGEICTPTCLYVTHALDLQKSLGEYGTTFLKVLQDSSNENSHLTVRIIMHSLK